MEHVSLKRPERPALPFLRESDTRQIAEQSVAARLADVGIPLHQMSVWSYIIETAILIKDWLVAN
jgi:hypothetical protein